MSATKGNVRERSASATSFFQCSGSEPFTLTRYYEQQWPEAPSAVNSREKMSKAEIQPLFAVI
jgi:hypothetical protein